MDSNKYTRKKQRIVLKESNSFTSNTYKFDTKDNSRWKWLIEKKMKSKILPKKEKTLEP